MLENEPILVMGGTRGTGLEIVRMLVADDRPVRVLARSASKASSLFGRSVEVVPGDVTRPDTLLAAFRGVSHVIFTIGVTKRPASETLIRTTEYEGVTNTLTSAARAGFSGRFLYMTAIGVTRWSVARLFLDLVKGNTLRWRRRAENEIRASGLSYTIIRAGILTEAPEGERSVEISQKDIPLSIRYRVGRADVARVFVCALDHPRTRSATFDVVWARGSETSTIESQFNRLIPDTARHPKEEES